MAPKKALKSILKKKPAGSNNAMQLSMKGVAMKAAMSAMPSNTHLIIYNELALDHKQ